MPERKIPDMDFPEPEIKDAPDHSAANETINQAIETEKHFSQVLEESHKALDDMTKKAPDAKAPKVSDSAEEVEARKRKDAGRIAENEAAGLISKMLEGYDVDTSKEGSAAEMIATAENAIGSRLVLDDVIEMMAKVGGLRSTYEKLGKRDAVTLLDGLIADFDKQITKYEQDKAA